MALGKKAIANREPSASKSVGIWIRVSTEDQAKGESPEHHEKRARQYVENLNGWNVREVYRLDGVSGKDVRSHPECERMMADIRRGHISALVFSKLARLARSTKDLLEFADFFREHDADLISLAENVDTSTPVGRLFYTVIAAMAQWEREEIADRVAASVPIRAKLGKSTGGAAPFGYQWKDRQLVPDPGEVPVRKLLYELFVQHRRRKTVARLLNEAGHRTRNGSKFSDTTVERLIRDPTAKGTRRANYTKSLGEGKKWVLKPETDWVLLPVEPIVSEELWDQCNALLDARRKNGKPPSKKPVHLFAGVTVCGCGHKMYVPSNTPKYVCYKCRNKIPVDDLEAVFHDQLKSFVFAPTEIERYLEAADQAIAEKAELLRVLEHEAERTEKERKHVLRLHLDGVTDQDAFVRDHRPLEERLKQLGEEIPQLQAQIDFLKIQRLSSDQILTEAKDLHGRWSELEREEKRQVIEQITNCITISDGEVEIDLCYLPVSSQIMAEGQRNLTGSWRRPA